MGFSVIWLACALCPPFSESLVSPKYLYKIPMTTNLEAKRKSTHDPNSAPKPINVALNEFFQRPVPEAILKSLEVFEDNKTEWGLVSWLTAAPGSPGVPRLLWLVILGSVPTGLLWYGYYKFAVEEELMQQDLQSCKQPRGFGGYGTLGPFVYGCLLGPLAFVFHLPGGWQWTTVGIIFIYYTQFLLYDRVNQLYEEEGMEPPLTRWWTLPIFFPFDLIVGLRQVHFLSQYWYRRRGVIPPSDSVAELFPFIGAPNFSWSDFC